MDNLDEQRFKQSFHRLGNLTKRAINKAAVLHKSFLTFYFEMKRDILKRSLYF